MARLVEREASKANALGLFCNPYDIYVRAFNNVATSGLSGAVGGAQDALRHCLASRYATRECGTVVATLLGLANEAKGDLFGQRRDDRDMDDRNNACGIGFGDRSGSCEDQCRQGLGTGALQSSPGGGGVY